MYADFDRELVLKQAKKRIRWILDERQRLKDQMIDEEIDNHNKWKNRFSKVGLGFLFEKELSRNSASDRLDDSSLSTYNLVDCYWRGDENRLVNITKACQKCDLNIISLHDTDVKVLWP